MANTTKQKITDKIFLLYLALFPFGQLLHGYYLNDLIVFVIAALSFPKLKGNFLSLLMIGVSSLIFSLSFFDLPSIVVGALYFIRLVSYVCLYFFLNDNYSTEKSRENLISSLFVINIVILVFGFIQYFFIPDLRFLKSVGWDDHYFRLVSTFLDPTFTGIILLLFMILALHKNKYALGVANLTAILFTYSRSTYLALIISFIYFAFIAKRKVLLLFPILLLVSIPILPRPSSEGVKLERTYSITGKVTDYEKSLKIFLTSPIIGIGFNNTCLVKQSNLWDISKNSHSCSGLDNSVLFTLATTGVVGLIFLTNILLKVKFKSTASVFLIAVLVHAMFANTLYYPFVMGLLAILFIVV